MGWIFGSEASSRHRHVLHHVDRPRRGDEATTNSRLRMRKPTISLYGAETTEECRL